MSDARRLAEALQRVVAQPRDSRYLGMALDKALTAFLAEEDARTEHICDEGADCPWLQEPAPTIEEGRERLKEAIFARNPGWDYLEQRRVEQELDEARKEIFRLQEEKMALEAKVAALRFQVATLTLQRA